MTRSAYTRRCFSRPGRVRKPDPAPSLRQKQPPAARQEAGSPSRPPALTPRRGAPGRGSRPPGRRPAPCAWRGRERSGRGPSGGPRAPPGPAGRGGGGGGTGGGGGGGPASPAPPAAQERVPAKLNLSLNVRGAHRPHLSYLNMLKNAHLGLFHPERFPSPL